MGLKLGMYDTHLSFLCFYLVCCRLSDSKQCYWSLQDGNDTVTWVDARLTDVGQEQARVAHATWRKQIENKIPFPESFYVSPLNRCLQTASITFEGLDVPVVKPFRPVVKEVSPQKNLSCSRNVLIAASSSAKPSESTPATAAPPNPPSKPNTLCTASKPASPKQTPSGTLTYASPTRRAPPVSAGSSTTSFRTTPPCLSRSRRILVRSLAFWMLWVIGRLPSRRARLSLCLLGRSVLWVRRSRR